MLQTGALPLGYVTKDGRALLGSTYINKVPLFLPRSLHEAFRVALAQSFDYGIKRARVNSYPSFSGADYGDRTRHLDLGKVALYQMS